MGHRAEELITDIAKLIKAERRMAIREYMFDYDKDDLAEIASMTYNIYSQIRKEIVNKEART